MTRKKFLFHLFLVFSGLIFYFFYGIPFLILFSVLFYPPFSGFFKHYHYYYLVKLDLSLP